ncbi:Centromere-associated protein E [Armadillidium nasatum]|uniref:Kinesin-like protein n=1 Tax=Armadillidium nasatum TaxID=96803 RepID=A0A5N5ST28_9CRUS|nr:Centromere-associated protein E [Armadillidium nasatum]
MSDNIVVALRLRPFISRELNEENEKYWEAQENTIVQYEPTTKKPINSFAFDEVFDVNITNEKIYNDLAHPIVQSGLAGFNGTIFAYGQTSSGKTYTMTGTSSTLGIIPLAIQNIFNSIENMPDREFLLRASYMEIYQENIYDLLTGEKISTIREDSHGQDYGPRYKRSLLAVMSDGDKRRKVGETNMNERSSRSHSIFRLIIESKERGDKDCQGAITVSHLNLVDLAGSENASQTGAVGERLREGGSINRSLFMLGRVISQLSEGEQHINFRDSKLTRILQNSLGGNAKTVIICTVTPANKEQTLSTVRFACRAKNIKNKPIINEVVSDAALLKRYALEIKRLRQALENERNTDKAQEMEQVKEKLDEQEKQNMELNGKIIALKEKLVVSSHPHVSSNAVDLKKRRMTWAAPLL